MYTFPLKPGCIARNGAPYNSLKVEIRTIFMSFMSSTLKCLISNFV